MALNQRTNPDHFYQTVNFLFRVQFNRNNNVFDMRFQSVSGLDSTLETETIKEGGENHFEHVIPVRRKYGPLVLKRGILSPSESTITNWLKEAFDHESIIVFETVDILLLNEDHQPLMQWTVNNVWPRSWKIGELNAEKGEVLIETLELNYNQLLLKKVE